MISAGAVNSGLFQMVVGKMLESGDLTGLKFTLSNAAKDLRYYTHFTESLMLPSIIGEAVHQSLVTANALGFGDKYVASLIEAQEKLTGVKIVGRQLTGVHGLMQCPTSTELPRVRVPRPPSTRARRSCRTSVARSTSRTRIASAATIR